uniref:Cytosine-specific methyltransferase n=1 Tax=Corethron hystrix TaxID=216773 RepID=A0A7S1B5R3_9STRA|mmetsp:Transcript_13685/g.30206  ORF Transcript_13685/g.30206 Transcript_13685/m.30206 type:complete len:561 (+) Transcript_13685:150-1832(+)
MKTPLEKMLEIPYTLLLLNTKMKIRRNPYLNFFGHRGLNLSTKKPILSNRIPVVEPFDSTIHPERKPENFESKMLDFLRKIDVRVEECEVSKKRKWNLQDSVATTPCSFTFCELFAGIGGFGVALEALGGKCVFASEIYEPSRRIYRDNLDTSALPDGGSIAGDIWSVDSKDIPHHDILVGGFPCQPFSTLGNQPGLKDDKKYSGRINGIDDSVLRDSKKGGGRGQLFSQIVRVLKDCQPSAFLLENVPGLIVTDNGNSLQTILLSLEEVGYKVTHEVCSSRGLTSQSRKRLYIVGIRQAAKKNESSKFCSNCSPTSFQFPFMPDLGLRAIDVLHTEKELNDFSAASVPFDLVQNISENEGELTPVSVFQLSDAQMMQLRFRSKKWKPAKLAWHDKSIDTIDSHYGVTVGKGNSQLVPCPAPHHPRRFTPRECARIMGFSDSFVLGTSRTKRSRNEWREKGNRSAFESYIKEQYQMLGNAVCPAVIAVIVGAIIAQCPSIVNSIDCVDCIDWVDRGLWAGIEIALDSLAPAKLHVVLRRLIRFYQEQKESEIKAVAPQCK